MKRCKVNRFVNSPSGSMSVCSRDSLNSSFDRKEKSRDAARTRRGKENLQYFEMSRLLPLPQAITSQLDKASIIRLSAGYLRLKSFLGDISKDRGSEAHTAMSIKAPSLIKRRMAPTEFFESDMGLSILQAMDGFAFIVGNDGRFLYVSETVTIYLGLSQVEMVGSSVFSYVHEDDHEEVSKMLSLLRPGTCKTSSPDLKERISMFWQIKCSLAKRSGCCGKSNGYKVIHIHGRITSWQSPNQSDRIYASVCLGKPLLQPNIPELLLDGNVFISRVQMDLKIVYCEGKIRKFMDYRAADILGKSAYNYYYVEDMLLVQKAHSVFVKKGHVVTDHYRWVNKSGGWVWMFTVASLIRRNTGNDEELQILCINYIVSGIENQDHVLLMEDKTPVEDDIGELNDAELNPDTGRIQSPVPQSSLHPYCEQVVGWPESSSCMEYKPVVERIPYYQMYPEGGGSFSSGFPTYDRDPYQSCPSVVQYPGSSCMYAADSYTPTYDYSRSMYSTQPEAWDEASSSHYLGNSSCVWHLPNVSGSHQAAPSPPVLASSASPAYPSCCFSVERPVRPAGVLYYPGISPHESLCDPNNRHLYIQ